MKTSYTLIFLSLFLSCSPAGKESKNKESAHTNTKPPSVINCYKYESVSDTVVLKLIHVGKSITGTLVYTLKEKDKNMGTIQGSMRGNILVADYIFMSEGTQSVRQVAFKLDGNTFIEGYGEILVENEKSRFKNPDSLTFDSSIKLLEYPCQ
ncbi:MAG: hypothetical protein KF746_22185 [Chitinophagaceae bacterium]|nr:hypothetical protein [Chitinophagaceae bacterium]